MECTNYLASQGLTLNDLKKQYTGRKFGELVLHHIKQQSVNQINDAITGLQTNVHPTLRETTDKFLETVIHGFSQTKDFWKADCGEALILYTNATKSEAKKYDLTVDDDYAFDIFNLIVLSLAKKALHKPEFLKHIKKSIKRFIIF